MVVEKDYIVVNAAGLSVSGRTSSHPSLSLHCLHCMQISVDTWTHELWSVTGERLVSANCRFCIVLPIVVRAEGRSGPALPHSGVPLLYSVTAARLVNTIHHKRSGGICRDYWLARRTVLYAGEREGGRLIFPVPLLIIQSPAWLGQYCHLLFCPASLPRLDVRWGHSGRLVITSAATNTSDNQSLLGSTSCNIVIYICICYISSYILHIDIFIDFCLQCQPKSNKFRNITLKNANN